VTPAPEYRFGAFALRPATRELLANGQPQRLGERAFDILLALVQVGGEPVSRETLFDRAWPGRAVLDDNLKVQVMALRRALGAEVVLTVPGRGYRLGLPVQAGGADAAPAVQATAAAPTAATLFGREALLDQLGTLLAQERLVSLVGPGGMGKTRLALAAVERCARTAFGDGHAWVELAPLADARMLPSTVARALALPPGAGEAAITAALRPLRLLLVLDNAEHLRDAVATWTAAVLAAAPQVTVLVTSQEPLQLAAERVLRVEGLATPGDDTAAAVNASAAGALFLARARAVDDRFVLDETNAAAVAEICRRLDGIPLALELAAARVPLLGAAGVAQRLGEALALLTRGARDAPARQQTLRAALQWSHALIDAPQKAVFRRLGVFAGGFELASAERVAAFGGLDDWGVLDQLEALLAKSLLQVDPGAGTRRFRLLEAARQFALERLQDAGEAATARRRHAEALLAIFEVANERLNATPTLPWLHALQPELPNLRAALEWALGVDGDLGLAIRLCGASGVFWALVGLDAESGPIMRRLERHVDERVPLFDRARFWLAVVQRNSDPSYSPAELLQAAERAVALAREGGFALLLYRALGLWLPLAHRMGVAVDVAATAAEMRSLEGADWSPLQRRARRATEAFAAFVAGDWPQVAEAARREAALMREAGDLYRAWFAAHRLALAETALGRPGQAVAAMRQAVDEIRAAGLLRHCWQQVAMLSVTMIEAGGAPAETVHEVVRLLRGAGAVSWMGSHLAEWLVQQRQAADAARFMGWLARRRAERGERPDGHAQQALQRAEAGLQALASAEQIAAWRAEGETWLDDDAALALLAVPAR
jgi:predicted ATPase/DNA-binding winged helix-turn-helix (wHTH) protein